MEPLARKTGPVEVWLSLKNRLTCLVVHEDESIERLDTDALTVRGAQREVTGHLIDQGFAPDGGWVAEAEDSARALREAWRRFRVSEQHPES